MAKSRRRAKTKTGQQELLLDFDPVVPQRFSPEQAQAAAERRKGRKDELALNKRTAGFMKQVGNRFIPYSKGESDLVLQRATKIRNSRYQAKERVREKYKDTDVPEDKVARWAGFAASNAEADVLKHARRYQEDARRGFVRLCSGLASESLEFTTDSVFGSSEATDELYRYVYTLKIFVGFDEENPEEPVVRRKFVQDRWTRKKEQQRAWAEGYVAGLTEAEKLKLFDEALHNAWSRDEYWRQQLGEYSTRHRFGLRVEPVYDVPIEAYNNDPEARGFEPVDEGF